jgi:hypothetical protein
MLDFYHHLLELPIISVVKNKHIFLQVVHVAAYYHEADTVEFRTETQYEKQALDKNRILHASLMIKFESRFKIADIPEIIEI